VIEPRETMSYAIYVKIGDEWYVWDDCFYDKQQALDTFRKLKETRGDRTFQLSLVYKRIEHREVIAD
jgi:hypothetical protein